MGSRASERFMHPLCRKLGKMCYILSSRQYLMSCIASTSSHTSLQGRGKDAVHNGYFIVEGDTETCKKSLCLLHFDLASRVSSTFMSKVGQDVLYPFLTAIFDELHRVNIKSYLKTRFIMDISSLKATLRRVKKACVCSILTWPVDPSMPLDVSSTFMSKVGQDVLYPFLTAIFDELHRVNINRS
jgi:hypothetical protein